MPDKKNTGDIAEKQVLPENEASPAAKPALDGQNAASPASGVPNGQEGQTVAEAATARQAPQGVHYFAPPMASSLVTLMRLKGSPVSVQRIVSALPGGLTPPTLDQMLRASASSGAKLRVLRKPALADIPPPTLPCALVLDKSSDGQQQSCVLLELDEAQGKATVIFPETGPEQTEVELAKLLELYSGYAVFCSSTAKTDKRVEELTLEKPRHWFFNILLQFLPMYRDVAIASFVVNLLTLASPLFIMNVYDRVLPNNAKYTLWVLVLGLLLAHLMDFLLRNLRSYFVDQAGRNADVIIAAKLMDKVLNMRLDSKPESTGGLVNNLRELDQVRDFVGSNTILTLFDLPFLLLFLLLIAFIGGPIVILPLLTLPIMLLFIKLVHLPFSRSVEKQFKQNMQKNSLLVEIISGLETVKASLAQGQMRHQWEMVVDRAAEESARTRIFSSLVRNSSTLLSYILSAAVIVMGVYMAANDKMTQGGLIACVILVGRSIGPLVQLVTMLSQLQRAKTALKGLDTIMSLPVEEGESINAESAGLSPDISISNLNFHYPRSSQAALRGINLHFRAGEKVGIIGNTGSGKSTLARLLLGLYLPADGSISFGGVDIRQLDKSDLRQRIGFMPQDNFLFYGSVRENIALGSPWLDMESIVRAAEVSGVADFVRHHPNGYDMQVGERGQALSGGQRQAVTLARTLVGSPDVLVLDEPSSNLDVESEHLLMLRLQRIIENKTLILLTHRLSLLALVNRVIVLHDGQLVADGPRDAVLAALREGRIKKGARHDR